MSGETPSTPPEPDAAPTDADRRAARRRALSAARLAGVQALFQMELTGAGEAEVRAEFENHRLGAEIEGAQYAEADLSLFRRVLSGAVARQRLIDQTTDAALVERWPLGAIDPTLRAIFRGAGGELSDPDGAPARVVINEYVDVAQAFFPSGKEARFANGVMDHMARRLRPQDFDAAGEPA